MARYPALELVDKIRQAALGPGGHLAGMLGKPVNLKENHAEALGWDEGEAGKGQNQC